MAPPHLKPGTPFTVYVAGEGGLGNSLFQIATGMWYRKHYGMRLVLVKSSERLLYGSHVHAQLRKEQRSSFLQVCGSSPECQARAARIGSRHYVDTIFRKFAFGVIPTGEGAPVIAWNNYGGEHIVPTKDILIQGYCQNISLFADAREELAEALSFDPMLPATMARYIGLSDGICVGVRTASDFSHMTRVNGDRYRLAIQTVHNLRPQTKNQRIFVFSDVFGAFSRKYCPEISVVDVLEDDIDQLTLGRECKNWILCESTFHWWMAFLSPASNPPYNGIITVFNNTDLTVRSLTLKHFHLIWSPQASP